jgi:hypothetical protein
MEQLRAMRATMRAMRRRGGCGGQARHADDDGRGLGPLSQRAQERCRHGAGLLEARSLAVR